MAPTLMHIRPIATFILCICCAGLSAPAAQAERADRTKPIHLESDRMRVDDAQKTSVFEGNVVMTQGTLSIRADRVTVRQDREGNQYGSAEYIQGEAERIEYDGKLDRVEFFNNARLLREPADEVRGNYISYDARTEYFTVNDGAGASGAPAGRVSAVIQPRTTAEESGKTAAPDANKR